MPPLTCAIPALRQTEHSSKTEVTPRELGSSNARACPELHLACRASHHHHQPSRLLCAQGSETSTPHIQHGQGKRCAREPCPRTRARLIKSSAYTRTDAPFLLSPGQVRASRSSRSPTTLARRSKHTQPVPPRCGAIIALAHPAPHLCRAAPCACILTLITHACRRALRAQEHEAAQGRVDGPLLGCPRALLERQGEPRRPCRAKSSREHQGHGGEGPRALRCALLVCRAGCHPQSRRSQSKIAPVAHVHYVKKACTISLFWREEGRSGVRAIQ